MCKERKVKKKKEGDEVMIDTFFSLSDFIKEVSNKGIIKEKHIFK